MNCKDRLTRPLKKTKNGFKPVSWNEALDTIADRLIKIREKYGPEALVMCKDSTSTEDSVDAFCQFMALYGSPNITGSSHLCFVPAEIASASVYGTHTYPDYSKTKFVILWGGIKQRLQNNLELNTSFSLMYGNHFVQIGDDEIRLTEKILWA